MLEKSQSQGLAERVPGRDVRFLDLDRLLSALLRQWRIFAICIGIGLMLGVVYLSLAPRLYYSEGAILIDQNVQGMVSDVMNQTSVATIESELSNQSELLRSSRVARSVVEAEGLNTDVTFLNPPPSFTGRLRQIVLGPFGGGERRQLTEISVEDATEYLKGGLVVGRVGRSSVLSVGYMSHSPELAQRIASAYAQAFTREQLNGDIASQATSWLQDQLVQLSASRRQASDAVEAFRLSSGHSVAQDQRLFQQRLDGLTAQLVVAQSETARARALNEQVQRAVAEGPAAAGANASVLLTGDADPTTAALLNDYSAIDRRIVEVTATFGADHPQIAVLQRQLDEKSSAIFTQLQQLGERYANALRVAEGRETQLRADVQSEGERSALTTQSQVELAQLAQKASALETLYNSFLTSYEEAIRRQSFPITSARLITAPTVPGGAISPRSTFTLVGATLFGAFLGLCFGAINELRERSFRLGSQVTRDLGVRFAGYLPDLRLRRGRGIKLGATLPEDQLHQTLRKHMIEASPDFAVATFVETLKTGKMLIQAQRHHGRGVVIGISSILPGEGKTTYAIALAELMSLTGQQVLLIDGDLRHPATSRIAAPYAVSGLVEALNGMPWRNMLHRAEGSSLSVLPAVTTAPRAGTDGLVSSQLAELLREARDEFDFVIVDLPPLGPIVDARSIIPYTDGVMLVVEWGRTPRRLVRTTLEQDAQIEASVIGAVLNKVNLPKLSRYSEMGEAERYMGAYGNYFRPAPPAKI